MEEFKDGIVAFYIELFAVARNLRRAYKGLDNINRQNLAEFTEVHNAKFKIDLTELERSIEILYLFS